MFRHQRHLRSVHDRTKLDFHSLVWKNQHESVDEPNSVRCWHITLGRGGCQKIFDVLAEWERCEPFVWSGKKSKLKIKIEKLQSSWKHCFELDASMFQCLQKLFARSFQCFQVQSSTTLLSYSSFHVRTSRNMLTELLWWEWWLWNRWKQKGALKIKFVQLTS